MIRPISAIQQRTTDAELNGNEARRVNIPFACDALPPPSGALDSMDPGAMLAALMIRAGRDEQKLAVARRRSEERSERAAFERKLHAMRDKASAELTAGIAGGIGTAASGAMTVTGSVKEAGALRRAAAEGAAQGGLTSATGANAAARWGGLGKVAEGSGAIASAGAKASASTSDEAVQRADFEVSAARRRAEGAANDGREARKLLDDAFQLLQQYVAAKAEVAKAALFRA